MTNLWLLWCVGTGARVGRSLLFCLFCGLRGPRHVRFGPLGGLHGVRVAGFGGLYCVRVGVFGGLDGVRVSSLWSLDLVRVHLRKGRVLCSFRL